MVAPIVRSAWLSRSLFWLELYFPAFFLAALALGSYALLHESPKFKASKDKQAHTPYPAFVLEDAKFMSFTEDDTKAALVVHGQKVRRYSDTGIVEIDGFTAQRASLTQGQTSVQAEQGRANADFSEVQIMGKVEVAWQTEGVLSTLEGPFFHWFVPQERLQTHLPVVFNSGGRHFQAQSGEWDNLRSTMSLQGQVQLDWPEKWSHKFEQRDK